MMNIESMYMIGKRIYNNNDPSYFFEEFLTKIVSKTIFLFRDHHPIILLCWSIMPQSRMESYTRSNLCLFQIFINCLNDLV
jgi:hypothetical protein